MQISIELTRGFAVVLVNTLSHTVETLCRGKSDAVLRLQKFQRVLSESVVKKTCWTQELVRAALPEEDDDEFY